MVAMVLPGAGRSARPTAWMMLVTDPRGSANTIPSTAGTSTPSDRQRAEATSRHSAGSPVPTQVRVCARSATARLPACVPETARPRTIRPSRSRRPSIAPANAAASALNVWKVSTDRSLCWTAAAISVWGTVPASRRSACPAAARRAMTTTR